MTKPKIILGIETSCDETAAAVCQNTDDGVQILSNIVASSADLQAKYGGVIPEQAAREQLKSIIPVIQEALQVASVKPQEIDVIAVTEGPGLIGSLLIGVETAKVLTTVWQKPLVPVNHLIGHFYANWIINQQTDYSLPTTAKDERRKTEDLPTFPCIGLLVSGGHTDLVLFTDHGKYKHLGGTRDDAAGECFDKSARLLGLPYPGGPNLSKLAEKGNPKTFKLPRPMISSKDLDFSFSGLKTAVVNLANSRGVAGVGAPQQNPKLIANLAASVEDAITDVLVEKTVRAAQIHNIDQIIVAGGVAANKVLAKKLRQKFSELKSRGVVYIPPPELCTDNAAYIATAAFYNFHPANPLTLQANPNLSLSS